jgi:hypothetical protein
MVVAADVAVAAIFLPQIPCPTLPLSGQSPVSCSMHGQPVVKSSCGWKTHLPKLHFPELLTEQAGALAQQSLSALHEA